MMIIEWKPLLGEGEIREIIVQDWQTTFKDSTSMLACYLILKVMEAKT